MRNSVRILVDYRCSQTYKIILIFRAIIMVGNFENNNFYYLYLLLFFLLLHFTAFVWNPVIAVFLLFFVIAHSIWAIAFFPYLSAYQCYLSSSLLNAACNSKTPNVSNAHHQLINSMEAASWRNQTACSTKGLDAHYVEIII